MKLIIINIYNLFQFEKKIKLILIYFFVLLLSLMEVLGIALIVPAVVIIVGGNTENIFFSLLYKLGFFLNFENPLNLFLLIFLLTYFLKFFLSIFCVFFQYDFVFNFHKKITEKLFKNYLDKDFLVHINLKSSNLIRRLAMDMEQVTINSVLPIFLIITELSIITVILIFLLYVNYQLTIFIISFVVVLTTIYHLITKKRNKYWGEMKMKNQSLKINIMQQSFATIEEIKILSAENIIKKKFDEYNKNVSDSNKYQSTILDSGKFFIEIIGVIVVTILIALFIDEMKADNIIIMSVYAASAFRFLPSINRIISAIQRVTYSAPAVNLILGELNNLKVNTKTEDLINKKDSSILFTKSFELKNISFQYGKHKIINNLDLKLSKYDKIGIKGASGSGKSTLLYILIGLLKPDSGNILIDGNKADLRNKNWHKKIGYAPQFTNLIDDTILENIIYGVNIEKTETFKKNIDEIIKICLLDEFLENTNDGLNTLVGENGSKLSGGQKQRIGIARSIFRNPEILIFDESTSSLDPKIEKKLLHNIFSYGSKKTVFIVSHKDSTLEQCDKIYEFRDHALKEVN
jgi:ATP-binding cassette, subfamily B, bacterial PglK